MKTFLKGGTVITGDGSAKLDKGTVVIEGDRIVGVESGEIAISQGHVIDVAGLTVFPGIVNHHTHGITTGPLFPSGATPLTLEGALANLDRHLLQGTTSAMNVCGLDLMEEIVELRKRHPMNLHIATAHTPSNIRAALQSDGSGMTQAHRTATVEQLVEAGAAAIGEMGGGQTLGGGGQDYKYIPEALFRATQVQIHPTQAKRIKVACLGRYLEGATTDKDVGAALEEAGLAGKISASECRKLIRNTVMPSFELALAGFHEGAAASAALGLPAVFHSSTPSVRTLLDVAEKYGSKATLVAGHQNHNMFTLEESVQFAKQLKDRGVVIDISTLDGVTTRWRQGPENADALIREGLVDTISTDYAAGHWDGILEALHRYVRKGWSTVEKAIALGTGNVARRFPILARDRGLLTPGKIADVIVSSSINISRIHLIMVSGKVVWQIGGVTWAGPAAHA